MSEKQVKDKGIKTYHVHLVGKEPLLMNAMSTETLDFLFCPKSKSPQGNMSKEDKAAKALYRDSEGKIVMPSVNLLAALRAAGRKVKVGTKQISTIGKTTLYSFLEIPDEFIILTGLSETKNGQGWIVDRRRGRLPKEGKTIHIIRPKFPTWELEFDVEVNLSVINANTVRELFIQAGRISGLGDFRPSCKGPFGQFTLTAFEQIEALQESKAA